MTQPPAFQFYADDFLSGTADMTAEEVGVYIRLLCHAWNKDGLENNQERILMLAGQCQPSSLGYPVAKFQLKDGRLRNDRQEAERKKQSEYRTRQAEHGKKRWLCNANPHANPHATVKPPSPSSYIPTMEDCQKWLADWVKNGADYTVKEMEGAELALRASGWMWGKNPVTDFRAALERQIQTDRQRNQKPNYANTNRNSAGRPDRNKGTLNEGQSAKFAAFTERQKSANAKA